jgi:hypothetical protein
LYNQRWDEEKYFDNYKNDMANAKFWGKRKAAIQQQAVIDLITFILTRLFSEKFANNLGCQRMVLLRKKGIRKNRKIIALAKPMINFGLSIQIYLR